MVFHVCVNKGYWKEAVKHNVGMRLASSFSCQPLLVSQVRLNQCQHGSLLASGDRHWHWLGLACETTLLVCFCKIVQPAFMQAYTAGQVENVEVWKLKYENRSMGTEVRK